MQKGSTWRGLNTNELHTTQIFKLHILQLHNHVLVGDALLHKIPIKYIYNCGCNLTKLQNVLYFPRQSKNDYIANLTSVIHLATLLLYLRVYCQLFQDVINKNS